MGHTKTPWRVGDYNHVLGADAKHEDDVIAVQGFAMPTGAPYPVAAANTAHIVHCVNVHEALVEALKAVANITNAPVGKIAAKMVKARNVAKEALALAKEN